MENIINVRMSQKFDTKENWDNATLVPLKGEVIVYTDLNRCKVGNGTDLPSALPWASVGQLTDSKGEIFNDYDFNLASNKYATAFGSKTEAAGMQSIAMGASTLALGAYSIAGGKLSQAVGAGSIAIGNECWADGLYSTVMGGLNRTCANKYYAHAEGGYTYAEGACSHTEGAYTYAEANDAHAQGAHTLACDVYSHAEGCFTSSMAMASHAEGYGSTVNLIASGEADSTTYVVDSLEGLSIGTKILYRPKPNFPIVARIMAIDYENNIIETNHTLSPPLNLFASENTNEDEPVTPGPLENVPFVAYTSGAWGTVSHSEGLGTVAAGRAQHVQGRYNLIDPLFDNIDMSIDPKYAHIVGNGKLIVPEDGWTERNVNRSNAHTIDWDGNGWFQGSIYVGGISQDDEAAAKVLTEADMDTIISNVIAALPRYNGEVEPYE